MSWVLSHTVEPCKAIPDGVIVYVRDTVNASWNLDEAKRFESEKKAREFQLEHKLIYFYPVKIDEEQTTKN